MIREILDGLDGVISVMDDCLVFGKTEAENDSRLIAGSTSKHNYNRFQWMTITIHQQDKLSKDMSRLSAAVVEIRGTKRIS
jgi:hypothetical protein